MRMFATTARKLAIATSALALGTSAFCICNVHAEDTKMSDSSMMMSADDKKMAMEQLDKMKMMAADPAKADEMKMDMARMMVMEHMAKMMAMDPDFKKAAMETMDDPAVKKVHDEAKTMAEDPDQMKKMQDEISSDPKEMKRVTHEAAMMTMMHDKMGGKEMGGKDMKEMGDEAGKMMNGSK